MLYGPYKQPVPTLAVIFTFFSSYKKVQFICVQYLHGSSMLLGVQYTQLTDQALHVHATKPPCK